MRTVKKGLAMLMVVLMLLSLLPAAVLAEGQPSETEAPVETVAPEATEQAEATAVPVEAGEDSDSEPQEGENEPAEDATSPEPEETPAEGETETGSGTDTVVSDETQAEGEAEVEGEQNDDSTDAVEEETDAEAADAEATEGEEAEEAGEEELAETSYEFSSLGVTVGGKYYPVTISAEDGVQTASLLPLEEHYCTLDLSDVFPSDLASLQLQAVWDNMSNVYNRPSNPQIAWAKGTSYGACTEFKIVSTGDTLDLTPVGNSSGYMYMQIIAGPNAADQTDTRNVRYLINVRMPSFGNLFTFEAQTADGQKVDFLDTTSSKSGENDLTYRLQVSRQMKRQSVSMHIAFNTGNVQGVTLDGLYAGRLTETEATSATPIADGRYTADYFSYPEQQFTAVVSRNSSTMVIHFTVHMYSSGVFVDFYPYNNNFTDRDGNSAQYSSRQGYESGIYTYTVQLRKGLAVNGTYYVTLEAIDGENSSKSDIECVIKAVVGNYASLDAASGQTDIKDKLFNGRGSTNGYPADYSKGVEFTVFCVDSFTEHIKIKTTEYEEIVPEPSIDTYLQVTGAKRVNPTEGQNPEYDVYYISDKAIDSRGTIHQTVLIMDNGKPVTDETICPEFIVSSKKDGRPINVYIGLDQNSGTKQESGKTAVPFKNGQAIAYSAAAEDGEHLQNYWVTFITPQTGAKLFVNGTNVKDDNYDEKEDLPVRVLHLADIENPDEEYHDVLVSNVGDAPLTGLSVHLENAQNVQLDPYWTIQEEGTKTLGTFSTTRTVSDAGTYASYGELKNFARIRLLPEYEEDGSVKSGIISGYLVIGSANGGEVKIKLTGAAGKPKIVTETIRDGVKYVPYNSLIQTNNTGATDAVRFELVKEGSDTGLPDGVKMYPNGELYGVPQKDGDYSFHIKLISNETNKELDSADFTMKVTLNTDDNVWNASDAGYGVLDPVGELTSGSGEGLDGSQHYMLSDYVEQVFRSEGSYGYFVGFYLDGQKLVSGTDYTSHEGSTVITIVEQTLTNAGKGTHTIAAEFHEQSTSDGTPHGTLKNTAQNYTINVEPKYTPTPKPTATPTPKPTNTAKPGNTDNSGNAGGNTSGSGSGSGGGNTTPAPVVNTVTCQVYLVDGANNPLANYPLELHSTPMPATTTNGGFATFNGVSFGTHTLHALGTTGKSVASKTFTLVSGQPAVNGDTITIQPGASVKMTMKLNGNTLELVSAEVGTPSTGDETPVVLYLGMLSAASLALGYVVLRWKKEKDTQR